MSLEPVSDPGEIQVSSISLPFPKAWWGRALYGLFVTTLPAFSFWATQLLRPEWQNGDLSSYVILLLSPEASLFFLPLLAYSIICYLFLLLAPTRYAGSFFIRFGVYTGVLLALQYSIAVLAYSIHSFAYIIILTWILPFVASISYRWAAAKWTAPRVNKILFILILGVLLIDAFVTKAGLPFILLVGLTMAAPFWSFVLAVRASIWLIKNYETKVTLPRGLGLTAWAVAFVAAWRFDILKMYELYAALPPEPPPDCYIATAAGKGHPQFVGSWLVQRTNGEFMHVNKQLQNLKCAELAFMAVQPSFHKVFRKVYDVVGRSLAKRIQNPFLADIAYLLLKPWDWLARLLLRMIVPEIDLISNKMYTN